MNKTKKITISAALVALIVVILWLGSLVEVLDLTTIFICGLFLAFSVIELGGSWKWMIYAASAILATLLLPNKFVALEYVLLGVTVILKSYFERLPSLPSWVLKFVSFNILFGTVIALFYLVLGMPFEDEVLFGITFSAYLIPALLLILGNICFFLYDILLTRMVSIYYMKYRDRVRRWLRLN